MIIDLIGDVDGEMYKHFLKSIRKAEKLKPDFVNLCINSHGGDATVALAIYDRIKYSSLVINTSVIGECSSAAVGILIAGKHRMMFSNAHIMVHEEQIGEGEIVGSVSQCEALVAEYRRREDQWNELLEKETGTPRENWAVLQKNDYYIRPFEACNLGLIHEIIAADPE